MHIILNKRRQLYIDNILLLANITDILVCLKVCYLWFGSLGGCKQFIDMKITFLLFQIVQLHNKILSAYK